jgi:hypothetical protein
MQETTAQNDNALVRQEQAAVAATKAAEPLAPVYDADARNRFEFDVREGVEKYETAHVFNPVSDERYMQWLREWKIKGTEEMMDEEGREAGCRLWDDLIFQVEKIEFPEGVDFRPLISSQEKLEALQQYLAVAIGADIVKVKGNRQLGDAATQTVVTEAWFNGEVSKQTHVMKRVAVEWQKKHSRIAAKEFKKENIGGLRRQPKVEYVPQEHRYGELYDEMCVSREGFANDKIPLRFKTIVISHLFGERLSQKKSA